MLLKYLNKAAREKMSLLIKVSA